MGQPLLLAGLALAGLVLLWAALAYNRLVSLRFQAEGAWSDIDVQLKKRHDLVPNLVETVKGYAAHERQTLDLVVAARSRALAVSSPADRAQAESALTDALRRLLVVVEAYPDLKANASFLDLQAQLSRVENDLAAARRYYNAVVRDYNTKIESVPSNLIARLFDFAGRDFFQADEADRAAVAVKLG